MNRGESKDQQKQDDITTTGDEIEKLLNELDTQKKWNHIRCVWILEKLLWTL